jgi:serine/threonine-protein kinase SRPK3
MTMQDSFQISGPNGTHECLILELLGPSVADLLDAHFCTERLPGTLAKTITKQALLGLCFLHEQKIAHAGTL